MSGVPRPLYSRGDGQYHVCMNCGQMKLSCSWGNVKDVGSPRFLEIKTDGNETTLAYARENTIET